MCNAIPFSTYVINMKSQPERFETQREHLRAVGIDPERVEGYAYDDISEDEKRRFFKKYALYIMPKSNLACCYSHLKAMELFLAQSDSPIALVLEDDAYPLFTDKKHLEEKLKTTGNWDFLFLHCDGVCPMTLGPPLPFSTSAAAYFVTRRGARRALSNKYSNHFDLSRPRGCKRLIDGINSFWTDEDGAMSSLGTNRNHGVCPKILAFVRGNRGEKNLSHALGYRLVRIPILNVELDTVDVISLAWAVWMSIR